MTNIDHDCVIRRAFPVVLAETMKVGQIAVVANGDYEGVLVKRVYSAHDDNACRLVSIDTKHAWLNHPTMEVSILPVGTVITLTVRM